VNDRNVVYEVGAVLFFKEYTLQLRLKVIIQRTDMKILIEMQKYGHKALTDQAMTEIFKKLWPFCFLSV
jgi:hypothetical protein